jgi:hypothetical protein
MIIFNTTLLRVQQNAGSDATPTWQDFLPSGQVANADITGSAAIAYSKLALSNSIVNGDIAAAAAIAVSKLAAGSNGQVLAVVSGVPTWSAPSSFTSPLTTKGDIYTRSASADTRLQVGTDGQVLQADSTQATGLKWGAPSAVADASTTVKGVVQLAGDIVGTATNLQIAAGVIVDADVAAANKDGAAGVPSLRTLGSGAQQAVAGNDARLSDQRTPLDNSVVAAKIPTGTILSSHIQDGAILNADIAAAAAIEGNKFNWHVGTSPPGSPVDGMIWVWPTGGIYWMFRYDSTEPTYKWKFVGGNPLDVYVATDETWTVFNQFVDLGTGPQVAIPNGDWQISGRATLSNSNPVSLQMGLGIFTTGAGTFDAMGGTAYSLAYGYTQSSWDVTVNIQDVLRNSGSVTVKLQYFCTGGVTAHVKYRSLQVTPIRLA